MTRYEITINRESCIKCGNCYSLDPYHFEPDDNYFSMVVKGETSPTISKGLFDDEKISKAQQAVAECPVEIITVREV